MKNKSGVILFFVFVLILNLIWEFSHYGLYNDYSSVTGIPHLIIASFGDLFFVGLIFLFVSLKNKKMGWIKKPKRADYFFIVFLGLAISVVIEIINVNLLGRWEYKPEMPLVFGIGLSPLLQLFSTTLISLEILRRI